MVQLKNFMLGALAMLIVASACQADGQKILEAYLAAVLIGVLIASILAMLNVIGASVPLCCGPGVGFVKKNKALVATAIIILGILCILVPLFASMGACGTAVGAVCDACDTSCTDKDREDLTNLCNAFGFILVYTAGYGFVAVVLGIVGASLGCCICCSCCKLKDESAGGPVGAPVQGQPVQYGGAK
eukprot:TRINITY_DN3963_c0_g1_i4.p1 TRINITY_DN3963_c0_g1~~TRINITY_DN3963_c0_g1_i4.p1  ORF type:complete len:187 (+),score=36.42 TRINITY_DN3963_c0_g1_i4:77-637(+)